MKKIRYLILTAILLATSFSCCKDDDDNPPGDNDSFSEYFTCKINGVEFNTYSTFYCNSKSFYYYETGMGGLEESYMIIRGENCPDHLSIGLRNFGIIPNTGYMDFHQPTFADSCSPYVRQSFGPGIDTPVFDSLIAGGMNITTFTPRDSITQELGKIEGNFEFSVANEKNDSIIHITEGAFRFKVPNIW